MQVESRMRSQTYKYGNSVHLPLPTMPPCPKCKKEFTSIRQVTRHLNQPLGFCASLQNDIIGTLHLATSVDSTDDLDLDSHEHFEYGEPQDGAIDPDLLPSEAWDESSMDVDPNSLPGHHPVGTTSTREYFPGVQVASAWPGGTTFMADFDQDRYSDKRGENLLRIALGAAPATQTISSRMKRIFRGGFVQSNRGMVRTRLILMYIVLKSSFISTSPRNQITCIIVCIVTSFRNVLFIATSF
jgi:hypothetical protein